ncbi:hypothetical protein F5Y04DRAFT_281553 [Hypomontagnella monticulosa]|nr:hypothetical protein F5Y04DRAFT_281553 [Hypomontagnella monticulosa]
MGHNIITIKALNPYYGLYGISWAEMDKRYNEQRDRDAEKDTEVYTNQDGIEDLEKYTDKSHGEDPFLDKTVLLKFCLEDRHIRVEFWDAAVLRLNLDNLSIVDHIIRAYYTNTRR